MKRYRLVGDTERQLMIRWYVDYQLSMQDIAALLARPYQTVHRIINNAGVSRGLGGDRRSPDARRHQAGSD